IPSRSWREADGRTAIGPPSAGLGAGLEPRTRTGLVEEGSTPRPSGVIVDDRGGLGPGDRVLLIVEDDHGFARFLLDLAHEKGYRGLVAPNGEEGLSLAAEHNPIAIILDIQLPLMGGWTVLDRL